MKMPKVTILTISYNQDKYIAQTLESFIMQKTDFVFEVIIGDDCSTDGTSEIIRRYANKYPNIIKSVLRNKNIGAEQNFIDIAGKVKSEYVINCEGDDYFTDPLKLQKQVDFLDAHPECSICFHPVNVLFEDKSYKDYIFPSKEKYPYVYTKQYLTLQDLLNDNFIQTNSCMYRWIFNNNEKIEDIFPKDILPGDWFLHLLHAEKGKIGFINEVMAVYRRHSGGIFYSSVQNMDEHYLKHGVKILNFYNKVYEQITNYNKKYLFIKIFPLVNHIYNVYKKYNKRDELDKLTTIYPAFNIKIFKLFYDFLHIKKLKKILKYVVKIINKFKKLRYFLKRINDFCYNLFRKS